MVGGAEWCVVLMVLMVLLVGRVMEV